MRGGWLKLGKLMAAAALVAPGCARYSPTPQPTFGVDYAHYSHLARQLEFPDAATPSDETIAATPAPQSLAGMETEKYLDLSLEETMHLALANSRVLRDLGGLVLRSPDNVRATQDPSIVETDPRF